MMRGKRSLGQNFLIGSHYPQRIVSSVAPHADETIVEIGPGRGALTGLLVETGARILAIELDAELIAPLNLLFGNRSNFKLVEANALEVAISELIFPAPSARVVANLPYYISTPILQNLIHQRKHITEMTLMLQREVVDRIIAEPGGKEYGYLSVLTQLTCETAKLFDVPPGAFRPAPKVWSSVLRLRVRDKLAAPVENEKSFIELVKVLFAQRRKTILNNLRAGKLQIGLKREDQIADLLVSQGFDPQRRAETLTLDEMARLAQALGRDL